MYACELLGRVITYPKPYFDFQEENYRKLRMKRCVL